VFGSVGEDVRLELDLSAVTDLVGQDAFFESLPDLQEAYRQMGEMK
jgi:hypothetical protein